MKTCPYCKRELVKDKDHVGVYYCRNDYHSYEDDNGYLDISIVKEDANQYIHVWFSCEKHSKFNFRDGRVILKDFNILKGKSFEELLEIYNKIKVFS